MHPDELVYVSGLTKDEPLLHIMVDKKRPTGGHDVFTSCGNVVHFRNAKDAVVPYKHAHKFAKICEECVR